MTKRKIREVAVALVHIALGVPALLVIRRVRRLFMGLDDRLTEEQARTLRSLSDQLAYYRQNWSRLSPQDRTQVERYEALLDRERRALAAHIAKMERRRSS